MYLVIRGQILGYVPIQILNLLDASYYLLLKFQIFINKDDKEKKWFY